MTIEAWAMLDIAFRKARTQNGWLDRPVPDALLQELYDVMKLGPTSMNCSPARLIFVRSAGERTKLASLVSPGNQPKINAAPVTVIIGQDTAFHEKLPTLFPHRPEAKVGFSGDQNAAKRNETAARNSTLQGAYLMIAARMLGLDCGPMSGFDSAGVDEAYWAGTMVKTNFICSLGYGDPSKVMDRLPRLSFDDACKLV